MNTNNSCLFFSKFPITFTLNLVFQARTDTNDYGFLLSADAAEGKLLTQINGLVQYAHLYSDSTFSNM